MDENDKIPDRKASPKKTAVFFILAILSLLLLLVVAWILLRPTDQQEIVPDMPATSSQSPDPVKADIPPNGGTTPSPTGTGPGSNRSLLGPDEP